jgi:hypothetical protein
MDNKRRRRRRRMKTTYPKTEMAFNEWAQYIHSEAAKVHPSLLDYIKYPQVYQTQLEKVIDEK